MTEIRTITLDMYKAYMKKEVADAKELGSNSLPVWQEIWKATQKLDSMDGVLAFLLLGMIAQDRSGVYEMVFHWVTMKQARKLMPKGNIVTVQTLGGPFGSTYVRFFTVGDCEVKDASQTERGYIYVKGVKDVTWIIAKLLEKKMTEKKQGNFDVFVMEISAYSDRGRDEVEEIAELLYGSKNALYYDYI